MIIEIDQSGKVEETAKDTVVAFANGIVKSIKLPRREKRKLQKFFRDIGKGKFFVPKVFSVLIFVLIRPYIPKLERIIIDEEYSGYEHLIRNLICELVRIKNPKFESDRIVFKQIGKKSPAHHVAYRTFRKLKKPNISVTAQDIMKIIAK